MEGKKIRKKQNLVEWLDDMWTRGGKKRCVTRLAKTRYTLAKRLIPKFKRVRDSVKRNFKLYFS